MAKPKAVEELNPLDIFDEYVGPYKWYSIQLTKDGDYQTKILTLEGGSLKVVNCGRSNNRIHAISHCIKALKHELFKR